MKFWWKRYNETNSVDANPRTGRKRILSDDDEENILQRIREDPFLTAKGFAREYNVDPKTISAIFKRNGIKCYTAANQTRLTEDHRINRLAFCRMLLEEWDDNKLKSIIFSDEKTFCTDISWRSKVYRPFNSRYDPLYVKEKTRSGRITNNYWGAIGVEGPVTNIVRIDGTLNSSKYIRLLNTHVLPMMQQFNAPKIFMQDNCSIHTAGNVMAWFSRQDFELMDWPPLSPDLNPIENVWSYMENGWPQIHPRNENTLDVVVRDRWIGLQNNEGNDRKML